VDPEQRGRLRLRVPSILGEEQTAWAMPCVPFGGAKGHGLFLIPEIGAQMWVEFEEGDPALPIWVGTFWQQSSDVPGEAVENAAPTTRLLKTVAGHLLRFDDKKDAERFTLSHPAGASLTIDEKGTVVITDAKGASVTFDADQGRILIADANDNTATLSSAGVVIEDANGNKIEMASAGITVSGASQVVIKGSTVALGGSGGEPLIKGTSFMTAFNTHIHTATAPGAPTSPPVVPMTPSTLSMAVTTT
jgi:uncharacterized protein involved in type VI secretion and phage assembly